MVFGHVFATSWGPFFQTNTALWGRNAPHGEQRLVPTGTNFEWVVRFKVKGQVK